jgi:hypothetical protein
LVLARAVWLGVSYWPVFHVEDRLRFGFWLWVGALLALTGCWIAFRFRAAGWTLAVAVVVGIAYLIVGYAWMREWS